MDESQILLSSLLQTVPGCIGDRQKLKATLMDILPSKKREVNLLLCAYDEGVIEKLRNLTDPTLHALRMVKTLSDEYGLTKDAAIWSIMTWCRILGKVEIACSLEELPFEKGKTNNATHVLGKTRINLRGGNLLNSESIDYYQGEQLDFVLSVLSQVRERCPQDSRSRDIIDSLLSVNKPIGRGEEIRKEVQRIFSKGDPTTEADISALRALGFTYTPSRKHPKLRFHEKYMFVLASTPSDNRHGAKNKLSEINKCIAVAQKV